MKLISFIVILVVAVTAQDRPYTWETVQNWGFPSPHYNPAGHHHNPPTPPTPDAYDFIVVGGGTGGCAVASRLSQSGKHSILLLEAGSMPDPTLDIPALSAYLVTTSNYTVVHNIVGPNAGLRNGGVRYIRGKVLGGTSQVNYQFYNRGSPFDYDHWANITGDSSWSYNRLLPFFRRAEDYLGAFPNPTQHGSGGPIAVEKPSYAPGVDQFLQAGQQIGYDVADPNGPQRVSFTPAEFARRNGRRVSSYTGYIKPYMNTRRNLKVITDAEGERIEFDGNRAVGVHYRVVDPITGKSSAKFVKCRKEVIVSSGVIHSPVLLQKSGIGPKHVLQSARIPIKKVLPVGENLQDHPAVRVEYIINDRSLVFDANRDLNPKNWALYEKTGQGPYSSTHGYDGQAFISSNAQLRSKQPYWPDIQFLYLSSNEVVNTIPSVLNPSRAPWEAVVSCSTLVGRPKSRGVVMINPNNLRGEPVVDFKYFSDPEGYDMQVVIDGIRTTQRLVEQTRVYKKLGARMPREVLKECRHHKFNSDAYWRCYTMQVTGTGYHGAGTCAMGGAHDRNRVVDTKLRVIGMEGLRVVDASIMPTVTNANTHAAVYGIAEKASDMILDSWK